jgi:hypothetical protein
VFAYRTFLTVSAVSLTVALLAGCGGKEEPPPPSMVPNPATAAPDAGERREATYDDLVTLWTQHANMAPSEFDPMKGIAFAENMARQGAEGLEPILDELADPDGAPGAKVFATISLQGLMNTEAGKGITPRLIELTDASNNEHTRSCAAHLLGTSIDPDAVARVKALAEDPDHSVRTAARLVLIHRGEQVGIDTIDEIWNDPDTTNEERNELIRAIPQGFAADHLPIYNAALRDENVAVDLREGIVSILATMGNAESLEALRYAAENDPNPVVKSRAEQAIPMVESMLAGKSGGVATANEPS